MFKSMCYFSPKQNVVGTQKNCLDEMILKHAKHMFKQMDKTMYTIYAKYLFICT